MVKYSTKTKSIAFGDPAAFEICFGGKEIVIKSEFQEQLKWEHFFVYKLWDKGGYKKEMFKQWFFYYWVFLKSVKRWRIRL